MLYMVIAAMLLVNMLIAMMGTTYQVMIPSFLKYLLICVHYVLNNTFLIKEMFQIIFLNL